MKRLTKPDKLNELLREVAADKRKAETESGEQFERPKCPYDLCDGYGHEDTGDGVRSCRCLWEKFAATRLSRAGIPKDYRRFTLDNYRPYDEQSRALLNWIREKYLSQYGPERNEGLFFWGQPGRGKSHLAVGILQELVLNQNCAGLFIEWGDLLNTIRRSYSAVEDNFEFDFLDELEQVDVLLIDDLGAQRRVTQWAYDQAFNIVSTRARNKKTLIVTSMLEWETEDGGSEVSEKLSYAVYSKLKEATFPIGFNKLKHYRDEVTPEKRRSGNE